jgi:hypothetical protein
MLGEMELRDGGDASKARLHDVTELPPKLCDLGITKMQSHRWQLSASVPGERDTELHPVSRERLLPEGGRPKLSHDVIVSPKLNELGISLMQSYRWQLSASVSR